VNLTLKEVVDLAKGQSIASKQAETEKENSFWQWKTFKSNYKPQLALTGILPSFNRSFTPVTQPNGSVEFQSVSNNNLSARVSLSQQISGTGGTLFISSELQRFDDLERDFTSYNGNPVFFGFDQPLFSFNALKWDKKIEPLRYKESQQAYIEELEFISVRAVDFYFELLLAQVNVQIAKSNLANNDTIYKIGQERYGVGEIAKNELIQLQMGVLNAKKSLISSNQSLATAQFQLKSFLGILEQKKANLKIPEKISTLVIDTELALQEAQNNRKTAITFERRMKEAERDLAKAKGDNGVDISLIATIGLSNSAGTVPGVYDKPQDQQSVYMQVSVPLMDWGRQKSRAKQAEANKKLVEYANQQDKLTFEQTIRTQIGLYETYQSQLEITKLADELAQERYQISQERYLLGNISITNLTISLQEKDQAKRDYIQALRNYWFTYYNLRRLTLYDFETNEKI
jgi:hypothetical protein